MIYIYRDKEQVYINWLQDIHLKEGETYLLLTFIKTKHWQKNVFMCSDVRAIFWYSEGLFLGLQVGVKLSILLSAGLHSGLFPGVAAIRLIDKSHPVPG